jgi:hypothetical protein
MTYITDKNFLIEVAKGNVAGHSLVHKFGRNLAVPNGSWAFVSTLGHTAWPITTGDSSVRVKLGNAADTAAGAGAREITVQGISAGTFTETSEAIATAGATSSSATTATFWRVHRAWVSSAGTYGAANTAAVVIETSGGETDVISIAAGEGQTQFAGWTVPAGKTAYLLSLHATVDAGKAADIRVFTRADMDDTAAPLKSKRLKLYFDGVLGSIDYRPRSPEIEIAAKSDIWVEAYGGGALSQVSADFELLVVDD